MIIEGLDIELPIIQAPMAGVQDSTLAAAVCNAGGLGSLPCALFSADALKAELATLNRLTDRPFNLNFFCHRPVQARGDQLRAWQNCLAPYFDELDIALPDEAPTPGRQPFNEEMLAVLERARPAVVSFHFGLPRSDWLASINSWGTKILSTATTVAEAEWLAQQGADGIIAQGIEAGGHRGSFLTEDMATQSGTLVLVSAIRAKVSIPVIAAGGIAGPQDVADAMSRGASGVQVGTAFLLCPEAKTSQVHRAALRSVDAQHTALTNVFTGRPARGIVNRLMREIGPMADCAPPFPWAANEVSMLRRATESSGKNDFTPLWCGENGSACVEAPARTVLTDLAKGLPASASPG